MQMIGRKSVFSSAFPERCAAVDDEPAILKAAVPIPDVPPRPTSRAILTGRWRPCSPLIARATASGGPAAAEADMSGVLASDRDRNAPHQPSFCRTPSRAAARPAPGLLHPPR